MKASVVGSGIAGIASAIRLRAKGYEVDVFEANSYPGGKLTAFEKDGFRFDAGPSLFTLPHLVDDLFALAGENPHDYFEYERHDVACQYFWPDGTSLTAWADADQFALEVERVLGEPADNVNNHLADIRNLYDRTSPLFLQRSLHQWKSYFSKDVVKALTGIHKLHLSETMHQVAEKRFRSPKLVQLFDRFGTYNGSNPYKAPGVLSMIPHLEHHLGTYLPKGGMHAITKSLVSLAERMGISFHYNRRVTQIRIQSGSVTGVEFDDGTFHSSSLVISNMDIYPTYQYLLRGERMPSHVERAEPSSSALIFYWGVQHQFDQLDLHNIFFSSDYRAEFKSIFDDLQIPEDPTIYVNITSKMEPSDAPQGGENWFVMINVPATSEIDWQAVIPEVKKRLIARLEKDLNTSLSDKIVTEETLTPEDIEMKTSSRLGALYGMSSNDRLSAFLRHPNFSRSIHGLYFAGGSVHPGGGIPLCLYSAQITAGLIPSAK